MIAMRDTDPRGGDEARKAFAGVLAVVATWASARAMARMSGGARRPCS
jgi:hypothetical protein